MSPYDAWKTFDCRDLEWDGWDDERDEEPDEPWDEPEYFDGQEIPGWLTE